MGLEKPRDVQLQGGVKPGTVEGFVRVMKENSYFRSSRRGAVVNESD